MSEEESKSQPEAGRNLPAPIESQAIAKVATDCWNRIGVNGDGSCGELPKVIHCRNCPVYSAAGAVMLDRALPAEYRQLWTEHFAVEKKRPAPGKLSVVLFRIGAEWLALPTRVFQEVAERRPIHSLPHRRDGIILGIINVRGELLICISLGRLLGMEHDTKAVRSRMLYDRVVVADWEGSRLTFPVDEIHGVHRFHPEDLKDPPATIARSNPNFMRGIAAWNARTVGCLDEEALFSTLNRNLS